MKNDYKVGDYVKCIKSNFDNLTDGKIYVISSIPALDGKIIRVLNDEGMECGYYTYRFEPVNLTVSDNPTIDELVAYGRSLIGKPCRDTYGDKHTPHELVVFINKKEASNSSCLVLEEFDKSGFCVVARSGIHSYPVQLLTPIKEVMSLVLTEDYTAMVYKDKVTVGCQTITRKKVEELLEMMKSLD